MNDLYRALCSYDNLERAFKKARKGKTLRPYVIEFQNNLHKNLLQLRADLLFHAYTPEPLKTFVVRDPKTRKICKSEFRDRVVHHAIVNILEPIYERVFIYDSFANRKGKGTLAAIRRFDLFKRKVASLSLSLSLSHNPVKGFCLKADIRHYFEAINHNILVRILRKKINDKCVIFLIRRILNNYPSKLPGKGMPLGNITSQFLANVYLNELDQFVKHELKVKYYIRYVDDFAILHKNKFILKEYEERINLFLKDKLTITLHPTKSRIIPLSRGIDFLGFRHFYFHRLLRKSNIKRTKHIMQEFQQSSEKHVLNMEFQGKLLGWAAYAKHANTYNMRHNMLGPLERLL